jgi:hypothetical protein
VLGGAARAATAAGSLPSMIWSRYAAPAGAMP